MVAWWAIFEICLCAPSTLKSHPQSFKFHLFFLVCISAIWFHSAVRTINGVDEYTAHTQRSTFIYNSKQSPMRHSVYANFRTGSILFKTLLLFPVLVPFHNFSFLFIHHAHPFIHCIYVYMYTDNYHIHSMYLLFALSLVQLYTWLYNTCKHTNTHSLACNLTIRCRFLYQQHHHQHQHHHRPCCFFFIFYFLNFFSTHLYEYFVFHLLVHARYAIVRILLCTGKIFITRELKCARILWVLKKQRTK